MDPVVAETLTWVFRLIGLVAAIMGGFILKVLSAIYSGQAELKAEMARFKAQYAIRSGEQSDIDGAVKLLRETQERHERIIGEMRDDLTAIKAALKARDDWRQKVEKQLKNIASTVGAIRVDF